MIHITSLEENLDLFKALGSDIRVQILNILLKNGGLTMNQLATQLNITNGALTGHIKKLEDCGLISISKESGEHGNSKVCSVIRNKIVIDIDRPVDSAKVFSTDIKVGQFTDYEVYPTCGLANTSSVIGEVDDTRYFSHPDRFSADIVWFGKGYVEYVFPNMVPSNCPIVQLSVSFEISSEAPGYANDWPSDISFYINGKHVGQWTSPGDYGGADTHGLLSPSWWPTFWNQYGLLKLLVINEQGTIIDGLKISNVNLSDLNLDNERDVHFRIAVEDSSEHVGGVTLFGKTFGNYAQDIHVALNYLDDSVKN